VIHESVPENEVTFQRRRRWMVGSFAGGLLMLSIALELHQRNVPPAHLLRGLNRAAVAAISPDKPLPSIDLLANLSGILAVLRNLIPALAMFLLVLWLGARFVSAVYGLSHTQKGSQYLFTSLFGWVVGPGPSLAKLPTTLTLEPFFPSMVKAKPFVIIQDAKIFGDKFRPEIVVGGPATLVVHNDSAVLLERAGRLTRVWGPGRHPLRRFEKVRAVVDLRPRSYSLTGNGMTREGIPVKWPITVHFQSNDRDEGRHEASESQPFPYAEQAVFKAATDTWVLDPVAGSELDWRDRVTGGEIGGVLRNILARYSLDQLIQPDDESADATRRTIQHELEEALRTNAARHGARIRGLTLGNVELEDPAAQQWVETWKAHWKGQRRVELAAGKADRVRRLERARAEAKQRMLEAMIEGFQELAEQKQPVRGEVVVQRFVEMLHRLAGPGQVFPITLYPEHAINSLIKLVKITYENWQEGDKPEGAEPAA